MKKVFVALADAKYVDKSKHLFYSARVDGKWDGDYVLIVPEQDKGKFDEEEFKSRNIEIFYGPKLIGDPSPHYYKYYLWTEYFKKWDWIFYCDLDVIFFNEIKFDYDKRDKNLLYANDCMGTPVSYQFEYRREMIRDFTDEQREKWKWINDKWRNKLSFQTCYMLFHNSLIKDEDTELGIESTYQQMLNLHYEYYLYYGLTVEGLTAEQSIINIAFLDRWAHLSNKFVNHNEQASECGWGTSAMSKKYYDSRNYKDEGIISLHFYQFFQPWSEHNERFYPIWKEYYDKF